MRKHYAQYGNTVLKRDYCPDCEQYALVVGGMLQCCNTLVETARRRSKKLMSEAEQKRRLPSLAERVRILEHQGNHCLYCGLMFGTWLRKGIRLLLTNIGWDHRVPYSYSRDNHSVNYVAACYVCNSIKSDKIFETVADARDFIRYRRGVLGYRLLDNSEAFVPTIRQ